MSPACLDLAYRKLTEGRVVVAIFPGDGCVHVSNTSARFSDLSQRELNLALSPDPNVRAHCLIAAMRGMELARESV